MANSVASPIISVEESAAATGWLSVQPVTTAMKKAKLYLILSQEELLENKPSERRFSRWVESSTYRAMSQNSSPPANRQNRLIIPFSSAGRSVSGSSRPYEGSGCRNPATQGRHSPTPSSTRDATTELAPPIQCPTACPAAHSNRVFYIEYTCLPNNQRFHHNLTSAEKVEKPDSMPRWHGSKYPAEMKKVFQYVYKYPATERTSAWPSG